MPCETLEESLAVIREVKDILPEPGSIVLRPQLADRYVYGFPLTKDWYVYQKVYWREKTTGISEEERDDLDQSIAWLIVVQQLLDREVEKVWHGWRGFYEVLTADGVAGDDGSCTVLAIGKRGKCPPKELIQKLRTTLQGPDNNVFTKPRWYRILHGERGAPRLPEI